MPVLHPRVWSWDQPGAPVLIGNKPYSFIDILDALLIGTGPAFDGQDKCGWTGKRFQNSSNETLAHYNSSTEYGFGTAVRVYDANTDGNIAFHVGESFDPVGNDLVNRCRPATDGSGVVWAFRGNRAVTSKWWIIADERNVFIMISGTDEYVRYPQNSSTSVGGSQLTVTGFGDFMRWDGMPAAFMMGCPLVASNQSNRYVLRYNNSSSYPAVWTSRAAEGGTGGTGCVFHLFQGNSGALGMGCPNMQSTAPKGLGLWTSLYSVTTKSGTGDTLGYIRGMHCPATIVFGQPGFMPGATTHAITNTGYGSLMLLMESGSSSLSDWGVIGVETGKSWDNR